MKRIAILMMLLLVAAGLAGCSGVSLNAQYSKLLDQTVDLSAETATRAQAGTLPSGDMRDSLIYQAYVWKQFQNGRDGIKGDPGPTVSGITNLLDLTITPTTQPAPK